MIGWGNLAGMLQRSTLRHLGEDGAIDGMPARFVALNPAETIDLGESEYHGQQRRFAVLDVDAPPFGVGSLVSLRGRLFEVTAIVDDGEGMHELTVRERDPDAVDLLAVRRLASVAVTDTSTGKPAPDAPATDWLAWLATHGVSDAPAPAGPLGAYENLRWLDRHLVGGF